MKSPDSKERILKNARILFLKLGFENVSTDRLAKEARVSKATLYTHFPSLSHVLQEVVERETASFSKDFHINFKNYSEFKTTLIACGQSLLGFLNNKEIILFSKLMHEEARKHSSVSIVFFNASIERTLKNLETMFSRAIELQIIEPSIEPHEYAEQLLGMWEFAGMTKTHFGILDKPFPNPEEWSRKCVETILRESQS